MSRQTLIVLNLIITVFLYLLVPVILSVSDKKMTLSQIKKIAIINGVIVWLIFTVIKVGQGGDGKSLSGIIWAFVAYWLMKKRCLKTKDGQEQNRK